MKIDKNTQEIAKKIGQFYLEKNNGDYVTAERQLENLRISHIEDTGTTVHIWLERVGLLIGKRGENIGKLIAYLQRKVFIFECESLLLFMVPQKEIEEDEMWHYYNDMA